MKLCILLFLTSIVAVHQIPAQNISKELIRSEGTERAYYLFVPEKISQANPAPLIVPLHGSGRTGNSLVEKWRELAKKENVIVVSPDSQNPQGWTIPGRRPGLHPRPNRYPQSQISD